MNRLGLTGVILTTILLLPTLSAQGPAPAGKAAQSQGAPEAIEARPFFSRVQGLFEVDLPQLDPPGTVRLIFRPRLADFVKRDYLRIATGMRWAVNEDIEVSLAGECFATHGLGGGSVGYGVGEAQFGVRRILRQWPTPDYESSFGMDVQMPVGHPPFDLTDGHNHYTPSFVIQHHWASNPKVTTFGSAAWDVVTPSSVPGGFGRNQPRDDSVRFVTGIVYDLGQLKWTLETSYANTWVSGDDDHFFTVRPSVLWFVPKKYTFNTKTQWIVGLGVRSTWGLDGHELSTSSRVRAEVTFRQMMDRMRGTGAK